MKRPQVYLIILFFIFCISGCGIVREYKILRPPKEINIEMPQKTLRIGEKFTYKAEWLGLDVGVATLSVKGIEELNGRKVYHILATADTTPLLSKIYKVKDIMSTYIDVKEFYPVRFEKRQREGGYKSDEYTDFDQEKGKAYYFSNLNKGKKEFYIPKKVQDPLSCIYYFRLQDVDVGKSIFRDVNTDEKNYLLEAKIHRKGFVQIKDVGEWEAFMVEPLPWFQGKIKRRAKASIWFSADEQRIPLLVTTSGIPLVGTVTITLQKIEYLDTPGQ